MTQPAIDAVARTNVPATAPRPVAPARDGGPAFAEALGRRTAALAEQPTVSLNQMLDHLVGGGGPGSAPGPGRAPSAERAAGALAPAGTAAGGAGAAVLQAGERYLGVPYKWGGTDPETGFDCSGFVQQAYADIGVKLPRVSIDQSRAGRAVAGMSEAQPGDLLFWHGSGSRPNHIGIYAGEGRMLVAPSTGDVVRYQEVTRTPDAIRRVAG